MNHYTAKWAQAGKPTLGNVSFTASNDEVASRKAEEILAEYGNHPKVFDSVDVAGMREIEGHPDCCEQVPARARWSDCHSKLHREELRREIVAEAQAAQDQP